MYDDLLFISSLVKKGSMPDAVFKSGCRRRRYGFMVSVPARKPRECPGQIIAFLPVRRFLLFAGIMK
jgi:hypothetical protein